MSSWDDENDCMCEHENTEAYIMLSPIFNLLAVKDSEISRLKEKLDLLAEKRRPASALKLSGLHMEIERLERLVKTHENTIEPLAKMVADERELRLAAKQEAQTLRSALQHTQSTLSLYIKEYGDFDDS